jgi:CheY-like chemotaxis protein/HPt (histidine-containing phosphotransfer) domain-containing protein
MMGGKIWVQSQLGKGSVFHFTAQLNLSTPSAENLPEAKIAAPEKDSASAGACRSLRVLLAEDNPVNQKLAKRLLEKWGHSCKVADDGLAALEALKSESFDVILMDIQMPELDGLQTTKRIRQEELQTGAHIPIIALTAHTAQNDREICLKAGMDNYVSKPIRQNELIKALASVATEMTSGKNSTTPAPLEPAQTELSGFSKEQMLEHVGGEEELLREISGMFLETWPQSLATLEAALAGGEMHTLNRAAHSIKGAVGNFGAKGAFDAAYRLELAAKSDDPEIARLELTVLKKQISELNDYLQQLVEGKV